MRFFLPLLLACAATALAAPSAPVQERPAFLPAPQQYELAAPGAEGFALGEGIRVDHALSHNPQGRALIRALMAAGVPVLPEETEGDVTLRLANGLNPEWYELEVTPQGITICVNADAAFPLLAQTLAQAVVKDEAGQPCLPAMKVVDEPLFPHPGLMLDTARYPQMPLSWRGAATCMSASSARPCRPGMTSLPVPTRIATSTLATRSGQRGRSTAPMERHRSATGSSSAALSLSLRGSRRSSAAA